MIEMNIKKTDSGGISGDVSLPDNLNGIFIFNNRQIVLKGGIVQKIDF